MKKYCFFVLFLVCGLLSVNTFANSLDTIRHLNKLNQKREEQKAGTVTVEELGEAHEATAPNEQDDKGRD